MKNAQDVFEVPFHLSIIDLHSGGTCFRCIVLAEMGLDTMLLIMIGQEKTIRQYCICYRSTALTGELWKIGIKGCGR